jgi:hypothetical protein
VIHRSGALAGLVGACLAVTVLSGLARAQPAVQAERAQPAVQAERAQPAVQAERAQPAVQAEGVTQSLPCGGAAATVFGKRNIITFTGACAGLTVRGDGNHIAIALGTAAPIDIAGSDNQVRITAGRGGSVRVSGSNTLLVADAGTAPTAAGSAISGDGQTIQLECAGVAVTLDGNHSRFHLHGGCRSLLLRGAGNVVDAELAPGAPVRVEGDGSAVIWHLSTPGAAPVATILGTDSTAQSATLIARAPAPVAPPAGVTMVAQIMAALQGEVAPEGTLFRLPPAMFTDSDLAPAGQTALAQISQMVGLIHPAGLRIDGLPTRTASVQAWLVDRGQVRSPITTAPGQQGDRVDVTILR